MTATPTTHDDPEMSDYASNEGCDHAFSDRGDAADAGWMTMRGHERLVTIDGKDYLMTLAEVM